MSIQILQTMEWSRLCWDLSFQKIIELEQILPKVGQTYPINFDRNEDYIKAGDAFLLWCPPQSELTGWSELRPSEILNSYVIQGNLSKTKGTDLAFSFEVKARLALTDLFSTIKQEIRSPLCIAGDVDGHDYILWRDAKYLQKAKIGGYYYLYGQHHETFQEIIFSYKNDQICIHYSAYLPVPSQFETLVTNYILDKEEHALFTKLIAQAKDITEHSAQGLKQGQIWGAEYY